MHTADLPFDRGPRQNIRPVHYSYDPVHTASGPLKHDLFDFLTTAAQDDPALHKSSFCLIPEELSVSWQTLFPACRQSRQWREAEDAAQELVDKLFRAGDSFVGTLCKKWRGLAEILQVVETAVACVVYMYPRADVARIRLLAQLHVVMWIHDDVLGVVKCNTEENARDPHCPQTPTRTSSSKKSNPVCRLMTTVLQEIVQLDATLGFEVAAGALKWHRMSRAHSTANLDKSHLTTLSDYFQTSIGDVSTDVNLSMIRFAGSIHLSPEQERNPTLNEIANLWTKHRIIVKDLFSYEKECLEHEVHDSALINAIQVLQVELSVSLDAAKEVARNIQLDIEREIHILYQEILEKTGADSIEVRYVRTLVESLAGNVFYSSTAGRNVMPLMGKCADD
ncbi:hypothetical protein BBP40_011946 [Aspergillus hancockii]|nr:hypothetical protein BBP40_011946 [Aspergillus hancockii]